MKTVSVNCIDFRLLGRAETLSELTVGPDLTGDSLKMGGALDMANGSHAKSNAG